jgi:hypothetical protein
MLSGVIAVPVDAVLQSSSKGAKHRNTAAVDSYLGQQMIGLCRRGQLAQ